MNVSAWLNEQGVSAAAHRAAALLDAFLCEMEKGLAGEGDSSLAMIPAYVEADGSVPAHTSVAVIDAGGTHLRIGMVRFDPKGNPQLLGFNRYPMPGRDREQTVAEFLAVLVDALEPLASDFDRIGFCFSYPANILPNLDGRLLKWTKEIKIPGLVGKCVGAELLNALEARGISGKKVVVLNDTVATLLAGMAQGQTFKASSYVGFILGTGTNTAYIEQNKNIGKLEGFGGEGTQVINIESGGFSAFRRTPADLQLDARSETPGHCFLEKAISGAYLGTLTLELLQALASEDAFSAVGGVALSIMKDLSTLHIDNLATGKGDDTGVLDSEVFTHSDREIMKTVFAAVLDRAALLTAVNIAAAVVKSGAGKDSARPVCINIDGSTYYKTHRLAGQVQAHLKTLMDARDLHVRCVQIDDAPAVGAALAALSTLPI